MRIAGKAIKDLLYRSSKARTVVVAIVFVPVMVYAVVQSHRANEEAANWIHAPADVRTAKYLWMMGGPCLAAAGFVGLIVVQYWPSRPISRWAKIAIGVAGVYVVVVITGTLALWSHVARKAGPPTWFGGAG